MLLSWHDVLFEMLDGANNLMGNKCQVGMCCVGATASIHVNKFNTAESSKNWLLGLAIIYCS